MPYIRRSCISGLKKEMEEQNYISGALKIRQKWTFVVDSLKIKV